MDNVNINYPAEYEIGDIVFTCIGAALFGQISAASNCWSNHVGIIIGHNGEDFLVAESRVPLSTITTLSRLLNVRLTTLCYKAIRRWLTEQQKQRIVEQVPSGYANFTTPVLNTNLRASSVQNFLIFIKKRYAFRWVK
ncbi:protein [Escherichia coli]|uniref:Protein n=1 Tax=Escherichia coli TaxID=562 RepID=A0A376UA81_ECOLX|nr:protein [Escherichia coli]